MIRSIPIAKRLPLGLKIILKLELFQLRKKAAFSLIDVQPLSVSNLISFSQLWVQKKNAASSSTIFCKREQCRLKALPRCKADFNKADALQLCYDGKIIYKIDRYVFIGQYYDPDQHFSKRIMAVKSFPAGVSVTAQTVFNAIVNEVSGPFINNVFLIMADTTSLNSGKKSRVNKRLVDLFNENVGHDIHELECMFHANEIYFLRIISTIERKTKDPGAKQDGALLNCIKSINKPDINNIHPRQEYSSTNYQYCFSAA